MDYINVDGKEISYFRVDNDVNGNPRYVVHFSALGIEHEDYGRIAGLKKYRAKAIGGGYVFQSYNLESDLRYALGLVNKHYSKEVVK